MRFVLQPFQLYVLILAEWVSSQQQEVIKLSLPKTISDREVGHKGIVPLTVSLNSRSEITADQT